jgi:hypothetical protein
MAAAIWKTSQGKLTTVGQHQNQQSREDRRFLTSSCHNTGRLFLDSWSSSKRKIQPTNWCDSQQVQKNRVGASCVSADMYKYLWEKSCWNVGPFLGKLAANMLHIMSLSYVVCCVLCIACYVLCIVYCVLFVYIMYCVLRYMLCITCFVKYWCGSKEWNLLLVNQNTQTAISLGFCKGQAAATPVRDMIHETIPDSATLYTADRHFCKLGTFPSVPSPAERAVRWKADDKKLYWIGAYQSTWEYQMNYH